MTLPNLAMSEAAGACADASAISLTPIAYRGDFHDLMLDYVSKALRSEGSVLVTSSAAKALASIILRSTQGHEIMRSQLPWESEDRDDCWLVKGTPASDPQRRVKDRQFSVFIRKTSAEVIGLRCGARYELDGAQHAALLAQLPEEAFNAMYGPRSVVTFEPEPENLDLCAALYGGIINTPSDAIDYACTLAREDQTTASFPKASYRASEVARTWRITCQGRHDTTLTNLCDLSRKTGQVMSGLLLHRSP